jgi:hypothetical protein
MGVRLAGAGRGVSSGLGWGGTGRSGEWYLGHQAAIDKAEKIEKEMERIEIASNWLL